MGTVVEICPGIRERQRIAQIKEVLLAGSMTARMHLMTEAKRTIQEQSPVFGSSLENRAAWIIFKALTDTGYYPDEALMLMLDGSAGSGQPDARDARAMLQNEEKAK